MKVTIKGIGMATPLGGIGELETALPKADTFMPASYKTDTSDLNNYVPPRKLRRIDHFTRMTLLAAYRALEGADSLENLPKNLGIILCTGYGPSLTTFDFLDSIIDDGAHLASPLSFSHSVHNIPAGVLSLLLGNPCPQTTICQLNNPVYTGLQTAALWLAENRVENILFGAVDESTQLLEENADRIRHERNSNSKTHIGEGAAFFLLGKDGKGLGDAEMNVEPDDSSDADVMNLKSFWGRTPVATAFNMAAAIMAAKDIDRPVCCVENKSIIRISGNAHG